MPKVTKTPKKSTSKAKIKQEPLDVDDIFAELNNTPGTSTSRGTVKAEKRKQNADPECVATPPKKKHKNQSAAGKEDEPHLDIPLMLSQQHHIDLNVSFNISRLLDDDHKVSFIARYRKAQTGDLQPEVLHEVAASHAYLHSLQQAVSKAYTQLKKDDKATPELCRALVSVSKKSHLETLMEPHKKAPKTTLASRARAAGLEPAAVALLRGSARVEPTALIQRGVTGRTSVQEVQTGINHIICDLINKDVEVQQRIVSMASHPGLCLETKPKPAKATAKSGGNTAKSGPDNSYRYRNYMNYRRPVRYVRSYEYLAICRAEHDKLISVQLSAPEQLRASFTGFCCQRILASGFTDEHRSSVITQCVDEVYSKQVHRQLEKQVRASLKEIAEHQAMLVMSRNLRAKLLTPPIRGRTILALDPGYRACKFAAISAQGDILETGVVHPPLDVPPGSYTPHSDPAAGQLRRVVATHQVTLLCIGNGTACRETWRYVAVLNANQWLSSPPLDVTVVDEGGASEYSATPAAAAEMPDLDCTVRSAVSLARRLQDPLSELVKMDVTSLGVGMYQKDMPAAQTRDALGEAVSDCVGTVGVDVNTASAQLLKRVPGLNAATADAIVKKRALHLFANREQLKSVKGIGPKSFEQAAGFVKILPETGPAGRGATITPKKGRAAATSAVNPLDRTVIHPESYDTAQRLLAMLGCSADQVGAAELTGRLGALLDTASRDQLAAQLHTDVHTLALIVQALTQPGLDERQQRAAPMFWKAAMQTEELRPGLRMRGVVRNPTEFGAFVDLGIGESGLIHTSQMGGVAELHVNDHVLVQVIKVESKRNKTDIGLRLLERLDGRAVTEPEGRPPPLAITAG